MTEGLTQGGGNQEIILDDARQAIQNGIRFWADATTRQETFDRRDKLKDKIYAVSSFFAFAEKHPGDITVDDVRRWRARLEEQGKKPATVYARISRVSSFYRWLMNHPQLSRYISSNPAQLARPRYPQPYQSESVKAFTDEEMNQLLGVVRKLAAQGSIVGKRDYALLLFFFLTGLRRNEVISLRGKDLEYKDNRLILRYRRKGGKFVGREIENPAVYEALLDYLSASQRTNVLGSERPLWTRHDRAGAPGAPLSSRSFAENLKLYGGKVGIDKIHIHQTRHTYARIVAEETGSFYETQEALDHENPSTTRVYVQRITVKIDKHSSKIAQRLNILPKATE